MKRVYFSAFVPVNSYDTRLPALRQPPLVRENRLYQADWLMRFYGFRAGEIVDDGHPNLDLEIDPKLAWALRHPEQFPVDMNRADYEMILRVPGIGVKSAGLIVAARRHGRITGETLRKIGVVMKKAQYFITCGELAAGGGIAASQVIGDVHPDLVRKVLTARRPTRKAPGPDQGVLVFPE
jgi:predicted DNA-binding helix-hairpin-helix protein